MKLTETQKKALEIISRGYITHARQFGEFMWPDHPRWKTPGKCGTNGVAKGVGMQLLAGGYLGKLKQKKLIAQGSDGYYLTRAGLEALIASKPNIPAVTAVARTPALDLVEMRGSLTDEDIASATDEQLREALIAIRVDHWRGVAPFPQLKDVIRRLESTGVLEIEGARQVVTAHRDYWIERIRADVRADAAVAADMKARYGNMTVAEIEIVIIRLTNEIESLQRAGRNEMTGEGRRTSAAVSNEGARDVGVEKLRLIAYLRAREETNGK